MEVTVNSNQGELVLTEWNCQVFRFTQHPEMDHAYYEDDKTQLYIFETPELLEVLETMGVTSTIFRDRPPPACDEDAYVRYVTQNLDKELDDVQDP